jgi:hypothetical protein
MEATRCKTCDKPFTPRRGRAKSYCSSDCYYNRNGGRVTEQRTCTVCGASFWPNDSAHAGEYRQRACSRACSDQLRQRPAYKTCAWCGKDFKLKATTVDRRVCCSRKCSALLREQKHREKWLSGTRGRYTEASGYIVIQIPPSERPKHSSRDDRGRILEHRYVMECHLGRPLLPQETVHHKNGKRDDNRLENLELWNSTHSRGQRVEDVLAFAREIMALYG